MLAGIHLTTYFQLVVYFQITGSECTKFSDIGAYNVRGPRFTLRYFGNS